PSFTPRKRALSKTLAIRALSSPTITSILARKHPRGRLSIALCFKPARDALIIKERALELSSSGLKAHTIPEYSGNRGTEKKKSRANVKPYRLCASAAEPGAAPDPSR